MREAVAAGADRIILGTIFQTECKKGLRGRGLSFVKEICEACPVPVYAIGGIKETNLGDVMAAGAAGGCMMSGYMRI
jgi:thiamine-phosphate pyrophosphorylase